MEIPENFPPISRHMRYALVRNNIEQKGEYRRKLNEIGRDHKRKAEEILLGRSRAVRDHVINSYQAAQSQTPNRKFSTRLSISRDREVMFKINELSDRYLSGSVSKAPFRINRWKNIKVNAKRTPLMTSSLLEQPIETATNAVVESKASQQPDFSLLRSRSSSDWSLLPIFKEINQKRANQKRSSTSSARFHSNHFHSVTQRPRSYSAGIFNIRRRSCEFSINSKSLIRLQQMQQQSRLSMVRPPALRIQQITPAEVQTPQRSQKPLKSPSESPNTGFRTNSLFDEKIQKFCSQLKMTSPQNEAKWYKYDTKWEVVRQHFEDKTLKKQSENSGYENKTLKSNLCSERRNLTQKRSVRWSDNVEYHSA